MLAKHTAGNPFRDAKLLHDVIDASTTAGGAQKFPDAASRRISFSSVRSERAFRSRSFSFSNSFMRLRLDDARAGRSNSSPLPPLAHLASARSSHVHRLCVVKIQWDNIGERLCFRPLGPERPRNRDNRERRMSEGRPRPSSLANRTGEPQEWACPV